MRLITKTNLHKMIKNLSVLIFISINLLIFNSAEAQDKPNQPATPPPLALREVSGIVKDTLDLGVIGATVSLTSDKDTLKTSTDNDGIFVFKNVKSATYTIVVQSLGYVKTQPMRFKQNDMVARIVMDPIFMKEEKNTLNTVVISGTPSITYKTDTVEYKASDYVVRANASVDELLKKMEGMEVGSDGTLVHQGQSITKAKLNGKEYLGGDVANAIKNLPAEIVDKIQIVDDYGDQAARTGVKDGDAAKILNITTRTDKSVGNMAMVNVGGGNNERYETNIFATRINGDQVIGVRGNFNNTVNGVAGGNTGGGFGGGGFGGGGFGGGDFGGGGGGRGQGGRGNAGVGQSSGGGAGSGGTTNAGGGSLSWRDRLGEKINMNLNYSFNGSDVNALTNSNALDITQISNITTRRAGASDNNTKSHVLRVELEADLDSNDFLRIIPTLNFSTTNSSGIDSLYRRGIQNDEPVLQDLFNTNSNRNKRPQLGASVFYQHVFDKPRRNFSLQADINSNTQETTQDLINRILYLNEVETERKDSLLNRLVERKNLQTNYRGSLTYVEPLTANTQFEFNTQLNYNGYDNNAITRTDIGSGLSAPIDSLSNIYEYSFSQARIALNYRYGMDNTSKLRFSLGVTAIPASLRGTKISLGTSTSRNSFNVVPIARFEYAFSRQHRVSFNYSGNAVEPTFDQIQPVRDVSNPQNPIVGNPDLQATFNHSFNANYNNYIANSKLNYSLNLNSTFTDNAVIRNNFQIADRFNGFLTETQFVNMDGVYRMNANYSINKQLNDRKYNLAFSGSVNLNHGIAMVNGQKTVTDTWTFIERFGPRLNPASWVEVNPNISYNATKATSTLSDANNNTNTVALNIDGRFFIGESWIFNYNASKNYVSGISSNVSSNPFVVNASVEKELFNRRGKITFQAFDILNQNNFVTRQVDEGTGSYVDTQSNALSRYFMVRLSMNLQKWSGARGRSGGPIMRRGDGSFM